MINNDTAKSIYTVAEGVTEYPIGFQYLWNENNQPQILVYVGPEANRYLEYGTDFTVSDDGLSVVLSAEIEAGTKLSIMSDVPFIQDSDYVVGRIDPEQIEKDFDKSVLRDLQLRDYADDINDRLEDEVQARTDADAALQDAIDDEVAARSLADTTLQNNIGAEEDAREDADDALQAAINTKQDTIADLTTIRSGAAAGATAVQPGDLATVATSGSYNDLSNRPTIPATAADVHALPDTTKYGASLALSIDPTTFVVTAQLKDQNNANLGTPQTIDLPLESVVVSGTYDAATKEVVLTLESGSTIRFSVADLVSGLQTEITSVNMLDADLVDDTSSVHKFVTAAEKTSWDNKVSKSGDTMTGDLNMGANDITFRDLSGNNVPINSNGQVKGISINGDIVLANSKVYSKGSLTGETKESGTSSFPWDITHTKKINNGADIAVPTSGGTMARVEDLPGVMTGADGTNAGTSGLVPAPAATDNDKFLSGDGTWKAAGGGATYTAGNGISIDANNEISVTAPTLTNTATGGSNSLTILGTPTTYSTGFNIGTNSQANGAAATAVGSNTLAAGGAVALGRSAKATALYSVQINASGGTATNSDANTFKVANANGNFEIMSADGTIPEARLADTTNAAQGQVLTLDSNLNAVWQAGGGGGSSYTAGTGIDITNDVISVKTPVVASTNGMTIVPGDTTPILNGVSIGVGASTSIAGTAVGRNASAGYYAVAIGYTAEAPYGGISLGDCTGAASEFHIGLTQLNETTYRPETKTYKLFGFDGLMPADRIAPTTGLADGNYRLRLVMANGVPTLEWVAE